MMALMQENAHYKLNSDPGVMNKLNRVHAWIQEFLSGGGGGGGHQLILQFTGWIQRFYYRGEEGVQLLPGGVQRNRYNL